MEKVKTLSPLPQWLQEPSTKKLLTVFQKTNATLRFVGGCVRNTLLGHVVDDVDIAIDIPPQEVLKILENQGIKCLEHGIAYGSVTAVFKDRAFEITTLRADVETYGRHATVEFIDDWTQDAQRRDFTVNALYLDADGGLYDPTGKGIADLEMGKIRFIGKPLDRIDEDALRILRFFRFYAHYGSAHPIEAIGYSACVAKATLIRNLSKERITKELLKLLKAPQAAHTWELMLKGGILSQIFPWIQKTLHGVILQTVLEDIERSVAVQASPLARLILLLDTDNAIVRRLAEVLALSSQQLKSLNLYTFFQNEFPVRVDKSKLCTWLYYYKSDPTIDLCLLNAAWRGKKGEKVNKSFCDELGQQIEFCHKWKQPKFPLNGDDLIQLGFQPGAALGHRLRHLEKWWIEKDFHPTREDLLFQAVQDQPLELV